SVMAATQRECFAQSTCAIWWPCRSCLLASRLTSNAGSVGKRSTESRRNRQPLRKQPLLPRMSRPTASNGLADSSGGLQIAYWGGASESVRLPSARMDRRLRRRIEGGGVGPCRPAHRLLLRAARAGTGGELGL